LVPSTRGFIWLFILQVDGARLSGLCALGPPWQVGGAKLSGHCAVVPPWQVGGARLQVGGACQKERVVYLKKRRVVSCPWVPI
jgi:hypothetical protein